MHLDLPHNDGSNSRHPLPCMLQITHANAGSGLSRGLRDAICAGWNATSPAAKFIRDLELDPAKVNVNGGAMALGHPIAATGSMLIGTVLDELERRDLNTGLVTMCTGGGMAPAIIIERV